MKVWQPSRGNDILVSKRTKTTVLSALGVL